MHRSDRFLLAAAFAKRRLNAGSELGFAVHEAALQYGLSEAARTRLTRQLRKEKRRVG